jgi:ATP-binding cassette subfamily B protein
VSARSRKFIACYKPYLGLLTADLVCAFIVSAITLLLPLGASYITKDILQGSSARPLADLLTVGLLMLALVILHTLCNAFVDYQGHFMGALIERDLRAELFDHLQKLSFGFYDEQRTGQLMSRLTHDLFWMAELAHHGPEDIAIAVFKFAGVMLVLFNIHVGLTLVIMVFVPVMAVYAFYFNRRMNRAQQLSHQRIGDVNAQVEDTLAGIRVVQSFANEPVEMSKFARENDRFLESRRLDYKSEAYYYNGMDAFTQFITIAVLVFGGAAILDQSVELADLLTYILCVGILVEPVKRIVNFSRLYQEGITGFQRVMEILEVQPDIQDTPGAMDLANVNGDIEFRGVRFRYHDARQDVIRNISLSIRAGEYVALVGSSGVGKTTLCSLIPRFYEATAGEIRIDGLNIRNVTLRSLRRNIGIVQQDVYLFAGTVADNIAYGKRDASRAEIVAAAQKANAHDFIMALPNGYETDVGQRGVKLSGGQKQRLSIARVFLKDPPIVIFDEATSALDNESERAVQESMERLASHRTTLVIAHRLTTIRNAQRIVVLTDDGVHEQGTHEELLARNGVFAALYQMQTPL